MSLGTGVAQTSPVPTVHVINWATQHMASPPSRTQIPQLSNGNNSTPSPMEWLEVTVSSHTQCTYFTVCAQTTAITIIITGSPRQDPPLLVAEWILSKDFLTQWNESRHSSTTNNGNNDDKDKATLETEQYKADSTTASTLPFFPHGRNFRRKETSCVGKIQTERQQLCGSRCPLENSKLKMDMQTFSQ